ncbi:RNA pseudouridine synthase 7 isoform X2 [Coffea arabica]|uniref:RNA pseudouridine synthase 7 isoform X2 n=1 Tax=Coffea arabica TaxID=13443 RepID=A0A6P6SER5_COFAR|nr:RNA pseudouridine synthase 7-like isoform X2 [Coffea arabica]
MKRTRDDMEIVWQTPANPPDRHDYILRDGMRYVRPYYFEFISHVKNRWANKTIVDLFTEEFKGRPRDYYVSAVKAGRIQVDGRIVPISYVVQPSQKISHFVHRCIHVGNIVKTQLLESFRQSMAWRHYFISAIHRLDRLVSGLLILARSASRADLFRQQIESGMVQKQYIARVDGVFPEDEQVVDANVNYNAREGMSTVEVGDDYINGNASAKGKSACTKFTRINTNGSHSIVLCEPITGRTHQIRVHLQCTGHPIANDMLYLSKSVTKRSSEGLGADRAAAKSNLSVDQSSHQNHKDEADNVAEEDFRIDPMCTNCPNLAPKGYDGHEEGLWLHCVKYTGPDWVYECPYPDWAFLS